MATFSSKQSGTATISASSSSTTASITAVTLANAFLVFSYRTALGGSEDANNQYVRGRINSTTQLTFNRGDTGSNAITIEWQVLEFSAGVTVQRGTRQTSTSTNNVTISAVTVAQSWPLIQGDGIGDSTWTGGVNSWTAEITSTTNLAILQPLWESGDENNIDWQVIDYDNASVQHFEKWMAENSDSDSQTITSVTTGKTLLFATHSSQEDPWFEDCRWRMYLDGSTTVDFDRYRTEYEDGIQLQLYVVSISDDISVQRGVASLGSSDTSEGASISAIDTDNSFVQVCGGYNNIQSTDYSTDGRPDGNYFTVVISSSTLITSQRAATLSAASECSWEVCAFPAALVAPVYSWNATMP